MSFNRFLPFSGMLTYDGQSWTANPCTHTWGGDIVFKTCCFRSNQNASKKSMSGRGCARLRQKCSVQMGTSTTQRFSCPAQVLGLPTESLTIWRASDMCKISNSKCLLAQGKGHKNCRKHAFQTVYWKYATLSGHLIFLSPSPSTSAVPAMCLTLATLKKAKFIC